MKIVKERSRLLFSDYTEPEKRYIEDLVASMDNVFLYEDPDTHIIGLPTGMENTIKKLFPKAEFIDNSKQYWPYAKIHPVEHSASPRNKMQEDFINFVLEHAKNGEKLAGVLSPGAGKGVPVSTKLPAPVPEGYIKMGDLKVGDKIFGSDGNPTTVTNIFDRGIEDVYKVTFSDGRYALCDEDHLWEVYKSWTSKHAILSTKEMINTYKQYDSNKDKNHKDPYRYIYKIPLVSNAVKYEHQDVPIDPYVIGAFIGNGCNTCIPLTISSPDDFVPNKISKKIGSKVKPSGSNNYSYIFYKNGSDGKIHYLTSKEFFKEFPELLGYSYEKSIPKIYLYNDYETRMELLRGLMDTDGSISYDEGRFNVKYSSTSKKLLYQIKELIQGLGYIANISIDKRTEKYSTGFHGEVSIRVPNKFKHNLFTVPKKHKLALAAKLRGDIRQPYTHLIIKNIEKVSKDHCKCIKVDAPDSLFLTENFIVTHNTFMACFSSIKLGLRTLIIVPTSGIKVQWGDTLTGMFKVPPELVKVVMGPKDFINVKEDFVVVSQASLASLNKNYNLEEIMKNNKFGIKVIDEVQMWFHNIIKVDACCNIFNNWYITGTFGRSGETENRIYQEMFGDLAIFREKEKKPTLLNPKPGNIYGLKPHVHCKMMWTKSGLSKEEIKTVTSSMRYSEREGKWMRFGISVPAYTELVIPNDGTMTKYLKTCLKVIKKAENSINYGSTLILCSTINSCEIVANYTQQMFPNKKVGTYHSRHSKQENADNKKNCDILVSTPSSAGTGFDVKGLSRLIVLSPFKSWVLSSQIHGRLRRRDDGKDTYMWEVVDAQIPQLRAWANVRADEYRRASKTFKVIDIDL